METILSRSSLLIMPFWFLMIFFPTWKWTKHIIASPWIAACAALYVVLALPGVLQILSAVMNPSLGSIQGLHRTPTGATIA